MEAREQSFAPDDAYPELDPILLHWEALAAKSFEGFVTKGRGFVVLRLSSNGHSISYQPGVPCDCHREAIEQYNPSTQVVVSVEDADGAEQYCLEGVPTPEEAFAAATADLVDAQVH